MDKKYQDHLYLKKMQMKYVRKRKNDEQCHKVATKKPKEKTNLTNDENGDTRVILLLNKNQFPDTLNENFENKFNIEVSANSFCSNVSQDSHSSFYFDQISECSFKKTIHCVTLIIVSLMNLKYVMVKIVVFIVKNRIRWF